MKKLAFSLIATTGLLFTSCDKDDDGPGEISKEIENPTSYTFTRDGESTVNFSGQTTRIAMGEEILSLIKDPNTTAEKMVAMYGHQEGEDNFSDTDLNASDKNMISKTAASEDYFSNSPSVQAAIRADFESYLNKQASEVFPNWGVAAAAGTAGQISDGSSTRYISAKGLEYDQAFTKGLIGTLMVDQALNNYLSPAVLDEADNRAENDAGTVAEGKSYTTMEHKWDEAYGYAFGLNADAANPNADLGADSFLNKYIGRVEGDADFAGIADAIFQAFKLGRAAIVAGDYTERNKQADIIKQKISEVIGIRAVFYLQQGKNALAQEPTAFGTAFHDLSEGYGFIYSLQFTRKPGTNEPYFTKAEVDAFLIDLMDDGINGLWDVETATLEDMATDIAERFDFTLEQASE
ncbi:DUF4856 domain-containing protein [Maribacter sp. 2210JD10-5]|uniref:DUF4856 domain-containing protein n=1 Tax=Maribacter sp. 2210JD10-5 TaxID=3386272 RepID=UPI0039BD8E7C